MKTVLRFKPFWGAACMAFASIASPLTLSARDHDDHRWSSKHYRSGHDDDHHWDNDHRRRYYSYPRSGWSVTFGTGYRGRGYYYGPPGFPYYYEAPGVVYYSSRMAVPRRYVVRESYRSDSVDVAVQRALARRGYYRGPIDGDIGPGSRSAIARFQRDNGLAVTGGINSTLLRSLGIG